MPLRYDDEHLLAAIETPLKNRLAEEALTAYRTLVDGSGPGADFLGWLNLPLKEKSELSGIEKIAAEIRSSGDLLVCIGIGGSYLGTKAVIEALFPADSRIRFAGQHLSPLELGQLMAELKEKDFYINVISKSGTTTEPGVVFRMLRSLAEEKYGPSASDRIIATTDAARGALRTLSERQGYRTFVIPDDVGGRFSVLSPVGLLPVLTAGADLSAILRGARRALSSSSAADNAPKSLESLPPALRYAAHRQHLLRQGKGIEILANFEPRLHFISEWWKQLFGESEGKDQKGIFPASVDFTTDLHSMGQWIQDGTRSIFETFLIIENYPDDVTVPDDPENLDTLNFLSGLKLSEVNRKAYEGTMQAHLAGSVPVSSLFLDELDEEHIFELFVHFEIAVSVSAYMQKVNPFDQPGVEAYKINMFRLLGKPGF